MASPKHKLTRLTLLLLKEGTSLDEALTSDREHDVYGLSIDGSNARLVVGQSRPTPPSWASYLRPHVDADALARLRNASTSAVLLLDIGSRVFAATFGHGRHLLDPEVVVHDFGLRVLVNVVVPDQLKSIDARSYDELTLHTRRDVSSESALPAFEVDVSRDVIRSMTGSPGDRDLARRMTGADSLALSTRVQLPELPRLCSELFELYRADAYKERFEFIDQLRRVSDKGTKERLDEGLVEAVQTRSLDAMHLAPPEVLDWVDNIGFRFSTEGSDVEPSTDPSVSTYLETRDPDDITLRRLKTDRVLAVGGRGDEPTHTWSVYRCVVFELSHEDSLYVLTGGEWFKVSKSFVDDVVGFVDALPELEVPLPSATHGMREDAYNGDAAEAIDAVCLDRRFIVDSVPDRVEVCDILTRDRQMLHVKKRGASSTLSHLFAQGLNSAEWLIQEPAFRDEVRRVIASVDEEFAELIPDGPIVAGEWEVAFVVITRSTRDSPLTLPFFSLVTLRAAARRLQLLGFRVSTKAVPEA